MPSTAVPPLIVVPPARSYSAEEWEEKREVVAKLYCVYKNTLKDVQVILAEQQDFRPTLAL
jgi:Clr5 domain